MSDSEQGELVELRRRAYGPESASFTPSDAARLQQLESALRGSADAAPPPRGLENVPRTSRRTRWVAGGVSVLVAVAVAAASFALGRVTADEAAPPATAFVSDLDTVRTEEDVLPEVFDSSYFELDPSSTRFIARVEGVEIYLAKPGTKVGTLATLCAVVIDSDLGTAIEGCGTVAQRGTVIIDQSGAEFDAIPTADLDRLSQSVYYRSTQ